MRGEKVMIELATLFMLGATMILGKLAHRLGHSASAWLKTVLYCVKGQLGSLDIINGWIIQIVISNILWNISPVISTSAEIADKLEINNVLIDQNMHSILNIKINSSTD